MGRGSLAERLARSRARVVLPAGEPDAAPAAPVPELPPDAPPGRQARLERARRLLARVESQWRTRAARPRRLPVRPALERGDPRLPGAAPAVRSGPSFSRLEHAVRLDSDYAAGALGRIRAVSETLASRLNLRAGEPGVDLSRSLFVDTETSGLAGGTGTFAFLIGVGHVEDGRFRIEQFLLRDPAGERAMLEAFREMLRDRTHLVTYNGKSFDLPLLETRFALNGLPRPFADLRHLDLLPPSRRLFKPAHETARLGVLESAVLGVERDDDIPGDRIPEVFFRFLRDGDHPQMDSVLSHNRYDLLTLAALAVRAAERLADGWDSDDPASLQGVGDHLLKREETDRGVLFLERALDAGLGGRLRDRSLLQLGEHWKRLGRWDTAVRLWSRVADVDGPERLDALVWFAKHEEHQRRNARAALLHVEDALERLPRARLRPDRHRAYREALDRRAGRLRRRIGGEDSAGPDSPEVGSGGRPGPA